MLIDQSSVFDALKRVNVACRQGQARSRLVVDIASELTQQGLPNDRDTVEAVIAGFSSDVYERFIRERTI